MKKGDSKEIKVKKWNVAAKRGSLKSSLGEESFVSRSSLVHEMKESFYTKVAVVVHTMLVELHRRVPRARSTRGR